jgi:hypothetical protein
LASTVAVLGQADVLTDAGGAMARWIWVSLSYATFGLGIKDGRVVEAAPIARWAIGKPERQVADFYRRKGAEFAAVP